jgi:hypothetical protein
VGFTVTGIGIMFCAGIIIIGELSLYNRNNRAMGKSANRTLLWFFSHYFFMATLILTLEGMQ